MDSFVRGGYIFDVVDGGDPAGEAVVLLHGFPQDQTAWSQVAPLLQEAGYRTLALGMRGASRGARPKEVGQYRTAEHVNDVLGLLDAAGLGQPHIVGHDWGGYVAWALACEHPERVRSLTAVSTPHPAAIKRAVLRSTQGLKSWYMLLFQLPYLSERMMAPGAPLWRALAQGLPPQHAQRYAERMADPAARTAALNWYRVIPRELSSPSVAWSKVSVPTMYVWGEHDPALGRSAAEATADYVTGRYRFEPIRAGHWIPERKPALLASLVIDQLGSR